MNEVLRIDPAFDDGGGYRVLGVVDYKVPGFAGGSKKRALENLLKALDYNKRSPFSNFYLAEYYSVVKKEEKALAHLDTLDSQTEEDADRADLQMMKEKGRVLRKKFK